MPLNPNAEALAVAELRANDPDLNVRPESQLRRLMIRPFALMTQPLLRELLLIREQLSLAAGADLPEDQLDALAANVYAFRREGLRSSGVVRLFFAEAITVSIELATVFRSEDGFAFEPVARLDVSSQQMRLNTDTGRFYVDVACQASVAGESGNVLRGQIVSMENGPTDVAEVTNPAPFTGGLARESNAQFAARIPNAISLRALVNKPGISQVITDAFEQVTTIQTIGFGDPEMERDLLSGTGISLGGESFADAAGVHIGGHTDIYVRTLNNVEQTTTLIKANGEVLKNVVYGRDAANDEEVRPPSQVPVLAVVSIELADPATGVCSGEFLTEGVDYVVVQELPAFAFSTQGVVRVTFIETGPNYATVFEGDGKSLIITYLTNPDVATVQAFVTDPANRPVCSNLLVKSFAPVFMDVDVTYFATPVDALAAGAVEATPDVVIAAVTRFLNRVENSDGFNIDDLYRVLYGLEITRVNKPIAVRTLLLNADGSTVSEPLVAGADDTEFEILDRGTLAVVEASIQVPLDRNLGRIGVSLGDQMTFTWGANEQVIEVLGVERSSPGSSTMTVVRLASQAPAASDVTYEIRRDTVKNVADVPRTSAIIPRNIRVFRLPI
jgi:hypothetical protein